MEQRDVVVVGGGPGGSTLAGFLAKRGRAPLLLERDRFPRFHIGESLLPRSFPVFAELGVTAELDARFLRKHGAQFHCSRTGAAVRYDFADAFEEPPRLRSGVNAQHAFAYQVPRAEFDDVLLQHAVKLGAEVRQGWEATEILREGDRVVGVRARPACGGELVEIRARMVVDATGRDALFTSRAGGRTRVPGLDKTALFTHYRNALRPTGREEGDIHIIVFDEGWLWMIPFKGDVTSVGAVCSSAWIRGRKPGESIDQLFDRTALCCPAATERLAGAERLRPAAALADFSYRVDRLAGDGWLLVGDAAGFLDPLFSTGAHLALRGAEIAAGAIDRALARGPCDAADFADYERRVRYAVDLFLGVVQGFYKGPVREAIFAPGQRITMRRLITSILAGDVFHEAEPPHWASFVRAHYPAEIVTA